MKEEYDIKSLNPRKNPYAGKKTSVTAKPEAKKEKLYEAKLIRAGLQDVQQGNVSDAESALREIREKYGF